MTYKEIFKTQFSANCAYCIPFITDKQELLDYSEAIKLVNDYVIMASDLYELEKLIDKAKVRRLNTNKKPWWSFSDPNDLFVECLDQAKEVLNSVVKRWTIGCQLSMVLPDKFSRAIQ